MRKVEFKTSGTCAQSITIDIDGDTIRNVTFVGGCTGNVAGVAALARGRKVSEVGEALKGIQCRNGTSCPDQLSKALLAAKESLDS